MLSVHPGVRRVALCALAAVFPPAAAKAHHPGGGGNFTTAGPIAGMSAATLGRGDSALGIMFDYHNFTTLTAAELRSAGDLEHIHSTESQAIPSLSYAYGLTDDLSLVVRLPYVRRSSIKEAEHGHGGGHEDGGHHDEETPIAARGNSSGFGDITVMGQYRFLNSEATGTQMAAILGVKAPTGNTRVKDDHGERFDAEFQPGSGSWDGLFGLALTQTAGAWSFDASVLYTLASEGVLDTNLGDRVFYGASVSYRMIGAGEVHTHGDGTTHAHPDTSAPRLDLVLELNGEWSEKQREGDFVDGNSGGNTVYIAPGVRAGTGVFTGYFSFGIPVVNDLNGVQSEPDYRIITGASIALP